MDVIRRGLVREPAWRSHQRRWISTLGVLFGLGCLSAAAQTIIHVPADVGTIQGGIDAAKNGDTVLVAPGTYNENIDFKGKQITLTTGATAYADAAKTIINGVTDGAVVSLTTNEPAGTVLNGFTIQGGHATQASQAYAGGVAIYGSAPVISNNIIQQNIGCGILVGPAARPVIQGNDIRQNRAPYVTEPTLTAICAPSGQFGSGTAISAASATSVTIYSNTVEDNVLSQTGSFGYGAGYASAAITTFDVGSSVLANNIVRNNINALGSGGIYIAFDQIAGSVSLVQNLVYANVAGGNAGVNIDGKASPPYPTAIEVNNTFTSAGEGLRFNFSSASIFENNIYERAPGVSGTGLSCDPAEIEPIFISRNDIVSSPGASSGCTLGPGNLTADPEFIDPAADDFHTQRTSPVVAAGDINAPMIPPTDLAGKNRTVCGTIDMGVYEVHPEPPIALTVTPNPAPGQSNVTLTAVLTGNCNIPTGLITFMDGATVLGTAQLNGAAVASFSTSFLFVGTHVLTATYPGDFNFHGSTSNAITEVITGPPTKTVLSVSPNPALPLQPITISATVSSAYTVPAGTITFMAGGKALAPPVTVAANGSATATISTLGAGTYSITAVYGGSTEYASSTSNIVLEVVNGAPTTTTLTSSLDPSSYGQNVTFTATVAAPQSATTPTGVVSFMDGATVLGTGVLSASDVATFATSALAVGNHGITAVYQGSTNDDKSTSNGVVQVVDPNAAMLSLSASPNPAQVGQGVTFTATAAGILLGTSNGVVMFDDGNIPIGEATLDVTGTATFLTSSLAAGTHRITAVLAATSTHTAASSNAVSEVIVQPSFSFTGSPITLLTGRSGTGNLQLTSLQGFAGQVVVTCNPPFPTGYTCSVQQPSILAPGLTTNFTYTLLPSYKAATSKFGAFGGGARVMLTSLFPMLLLSLTGVRKRRQGVHRMMSLLLLAVAAAGMSACGGNHYIAATPPGAYSITMTAVGSNQGSAVATTRLLRLGVSITP